MNADKLSHNFPGAQWNWTSVDDYSTLEWFGPGEKPTEAELASLPWPPPEQTKERLRRAVEDHVEQTAQSRDYSSAVSLASYTASTREPWAAEAQAFVQWRDAVWEYVFARLAAVESGEDDPPESAEALIADLPEMVWPE